MKFLVIGRTGTGKDTLREELERTYGWKFVKSYTTRKKRYISEDTHKFISKSEAVNLKYRDKVAVTYIDNGDGYDTYFATRQDVLDSDAYVVDPVGMYQILCNVPEEHFAIVYLCTDKTIEKSIRCLARNRKIPLHYAKRVISEAAEFKVFEGLIKQDLLHSFRNVARVKVVENTYRPSCMKEAASSLNFMKRVTPL